MRVRATGGEGEKSVCKAPLLDAATADHQVHLSDALLAVPLDGSK